MAERYKEIADLNPTELDEIKIRFWQKVDKRGDDECWLWLASKRNKGYGAFAFTPKSTGKLVQGRAHRFSFEIHTGPIGDSMVLHKCDTPACVNPSHLFLGSNKDNVRDMVSKGRHVAGGTYSRDGYERGEDHHGAKLNEEAVREIRRDYEAGNMSYSQLAKKYKIAIGHAFRIVNRKAWAHVE